MRKPGAVTTHSELPACTERGCEAVSPIVAEFRAAWETMTDEERENWRRMMLRVEADAGWGGADEAVSE